jgi:hypothetical protein
LSALAGKVVEPKGEQRLLILNPIREVAHHLLSALFRYVVVGADDNLLLNHAQLAEVLTSPDRRDLFIGGAVATEEQAVVLYRGNLEPLVVPLDWFTTRPGGPAPDFTRFGITDFGQTIRLGEYEAAADAILYEFDRNFRVRTKARALKMDRSLGASIRRLRLQKGLRRTDFGDLTEKTIARLERNEIKRPHKGTLDVVAARLGVPKDELHTY